MNKYLAFFLILTMCISFTACSTPDNAGISENTNSASAHFNTYTPEGKPWLPDDIKSITIGYKTDRLTFTYSDNDVIDGIVDIIASLKLMSSVSTPYDEQSGGGWSWIVDIESNTVTLNMEFNSNRYFKAADGVWWEISYAEAKAFEDILRNNIPDELPETKIFAEWEETE